MSYEYKELKPRLFTEDGQLMFLGIRDRAKELLAEAGCFRMQEVLRKTSGDSWLMLACVDRLIEIGELIEITGPGAPGQYRCFTSLR